LSPICILSGVLILGQDAPKHVLFNSFIDFTLKFDIVVSPFLEFCFDVDREQEENQVRDEKSDLTAAEVLLSEDLKPYE